MWTYTKPPLKVSPQESKKSLTINPGSVNPPDLDGATPLHHAARSGQLAMANLLLGKGANLSATAKGWQGMTPAHCAAAIADHQAAAQMAQTIIGNGSDVRVPMTDGTTVLQIAARNGHIEVREMLLRKGADPEDKNVQRDCETARYRNLQRDYTYGLPQVWINRFVTLSHFDLDEVKRMHRQCSDLLLTRSTWDEIGIEAGAHMGREDVVNFFLDRGTPVSLCTAAMLGLTSEVKLLLAETSNSVRERGAHDFPLLWYTIFGKQRPDIAELLLASGADVHSAIVGGDTLALARKKQAHEIEEVLKRHGA